MSAPVLRQHHIQYIQSIFYTGGAGSERVMMMVMMTPGVGVLTRDPDYWEGGLRRFNLFPFFLRMIRILFCWEEGSSLPPWIDSRGLITSLSRINTLCLFPLWPYRSCTPGTPGPPGGSVLWFPFWGWSSPGPVGLEPPPPSCPPHFPFLQGQVLNFQSPLPRS